MSETVGEPMVDLDPKVIEAKFHELIGPRITMDNVCLEPTALARYCPLDSTPAKRASLSFSLGALDILPLELRTAIFQLLDVQSLIALRRVSQSARMTVDAFSPYQSVRQYAPELLRAVLSIQVAGHNTAMDLYNALVTQNCLYCGDFGGFIYLFKCARVCCLCVGEEMDMLPFAPSLARISCGLSRKDVSSLPTIRSLPGMYSWLNKKIRRRVALVDRGAAERAGIKLHGSRQRMEEVAIALKNDALEGWRKKKQQYDSRSRLRLRSHGPTRPDLSPLDGKDGNPYRFMGILRVSWLNRRTWTTEDGLSCAGCGERTYLKTYRRSLDWRRHYSRKGLSDHVSECEDSKQILND